MGDNQTDAIDRIVAAIDADVVKSFARATRALMDRLDADKRVMDAAADAIAAYRANPDHENARRLERARIALKRAAEMKGRADEVYALIGKAPDYLNECEEASNHNP